MPTTDMMIDAFICMRDESGSVCIDRFWMLVERFRADLVNQALAIIGNQQDAEDAAQETLCKAFLYLQRLRDPSKLGHWLRSVNRREAVGLLQRKNLLKEQRMDTGQLNALEETEPKSDVEEQQQEAVLRAVDSLPKTFREVMVLRYWEKLNTEEIAVRLNAPSGTIRCRLARADRLLIQKLKTMLMKEEHPQ